MGTIQKIIFLLIFSFSALAVNYTVVSDLDDTIKITNSSGGAGAVYNALFTYKTFSGTEELFQQFSHYSDIHILTASPKLLRKNVLTLLNRIFLDYKTVTMRSLRKNKDVFKYKYDYLIKKITNNPKIKLILLGDNSGEDHLVYTKVKQLYPDNVEAIYIRKVKNLKLPKEVTPFISTAEVAANEHLMGRVTESELSSVVREVLSGKFRRVVPRFAFCPKSNWVNDVAQKKMLQEVINLIVSKCNLR